MTTTDIRGVCLPISARTSSKFATLSPLYRECLQHWKIDERATHSEERRGKGEGWDGELSCEKKRDKADRTPLTTTVAHRVFRRRVLAIFLVVFNNSALFLTPSHTHTHHDSLPRPRSLFRPLLSCRRRNFRDQ